MIIKDCDMTYVNKVLDFYKNDSVKDDANNDFNMIVETFDAIEKTSGKGSKAMKQILYSPLKTHCIAQAMLQLALNPFIKFNVGEKLIPKYEDLKHDEYEFDILQFFKNIKHLNSIASTNERVDYLVRLLSGTTVLQYKWLNRVLIKSLKFGISDKTFNKDIYYDGFIPIYELMLAESINDVDPDKYIKYPCIVQLKIDGTRCRIHFDYTDGPDNIIVRTRKGLKYFEVTNELQHHANKHKKSIKEFFLNFKPNTLLNLKDKYNIQRFLDRYINSSGIIIDCEFFNGNWNDTMTAVLSEAEFNPDSEFHCFDLIPADEADNCDIPCEIRLTLLGYILTNWFDIYELNMRDVPYRICNSFDIVKKVTEDWIAEDEEGTIIKNLDSPYVATRSKHWLKYKMEETYDGEIIEINPGGLNGKFKNTMGSITVKTSTKNADGENVELVGKLTGFNDDLRDEIWNNQSNYIGMFVEFKAIGVTKHNSFKNGSFKKLRPDK